MFCDVTQDSDGALIVVPLKDRRKRVFGLLGVDTLSEQQNRIIFITHEIQFFQVSSGVLHRDTRDPVILGKQHNCMITYHCTNVILLCDVMLRAWL